MGKAKDAGWYDEQFRTDKDYSKPFRGSRYFGMWKVVLGIIKGWRAAKKAAKILELGAGPGQFASMLEDSGIKDYVGVDFSPLAVEMSTKVTKLRIVCKKIEDADLESDKTYEIVVALEILEHLDNDRGLLKRLRPGTKIVFTVPAFDGTSHVRHFKTIKAVKARYDKFISRLTVEKSGDHYIGSGTVGGE